MSNWVIIHKSNNPNQSQMIKSVLEDNDIDVVMVDKMDSMHLHLTNAGIELHVNPNDLVRARHIISKNNL